MPRDVDQRRAEAATKATIVQVRVGILRRQLHRRDDLPESAMAWLEEQIAALSHTTNALVGLLIEGYEPSSAELVDGLPTARLLANGTIGHRN